MPASRATEPLHGRPEGFTLVELMVSMAVLGLLVVMLVGTFNTTSRAWIQGEGNAERQRSARALADFIGAELQGALLPVEGRSAAANGNLQLMINPPALSQFQNADAIFWQAPIATEKSFGDVAEVGYFVRWDEEDNKPPAPVLCRFFVNPSHLNPKSSALERNPDFLVYTTPQWLTSELIDKVASAKKVDGYAGLFAENVVGLWIRSYGLDGVELPRTFDSRVGYACKFGLGGQSWTEQRYLPARVKVSLAQIDSHHIARLAPVADRVRSMAARKEIHDAAQFMEQLQKNSVGDPALAALLPGIRTYSTDIYLENGR